MKYGLFNHTKQMLLLIRIGGGAREFKYFGKFISTMVEYIIRIYFSSDISCGARIGKGVTFIHGHDIVIGEKAVIGMNCKIFNGVTIGNRDTESRDLNLEQPVIENDCVLSTGAKILGPIRIGRGSIVGANAVVITDIPENSIAVGVPAVAKPRRKSCHSS